MSVCATYPRLLSPVQLGPLRLRNRVVMGSLHTRLENEPDAAELLAAFYAARAHGGVGLIITGGVSPNFEGRVEEGAQVLHSRAHLAEHLPVTAAVHAAGGRIALQVLHTGIYAKHEQIVGAGAAPSPINRRMPRMLSTQEVERTVGVAQPTMVIDHVVLCSGQEAEQSLAQVLTARGVAVKLIGGARFAAELDAMRAIDEGTRLAYRL